MYHCAASTDDAARTDGYIRTDSYISAKSGVIADGDGKVCLLRLSSLHIVHGMLRGVERTVRTDEHMVAYLDETFVKHGAVVVGERVFAYGDTAAMVAMERRHDC